MQNHIICSFSSYFTAICTILKQLVWAECVRQPNEVAIILAIIGLSKVRAPAQRSGHYTRHFWSKQSGWGNEPMMWSLY